MRKSRRGKKSRIVNRNITERRYALNVMETGTSLLCFPLRIVKRRSLLWRNARHAARSLHIHWPINNITEKDRLLPWLIPQYGSILIISNRLQTDDILPRFSNGPSYDFLVGEKECHRATSNSITMKHRKKSTQ